MNNQRVARGLLSAACLLLLVVGGAVALLHWGRLDAWRDVSWREVWQAPADISVLLGLMTLVGWVAWLAIAVTVVQETVAAVSHKGTRRRRHGGGGGGWLRVAIGALVVSVLGLAVAASGAGRLATPMDHAPAAPSQAISDEASTQMTSGVGASVHPYLVRQGDDLWSLAERFAGAGENWRVIADANSTIMLDPGTNLTPGMMLMMPDGGRVTLPQDGVKPTVTSVTVKSGDTLWGLAKANLGDPYRWPEIYQANKDQIREPGMIFPGQVLKLPGSTDAAPDPGDQTPGDTGGVPGEQDTPDTPDTPDEPPVAPTDDPTDDESTPLPKLAGTLIEISRPGEPAGQVLVAPVNDADTAGQMTRALIGSIGVGLAGALLAGVAMQRLLAMRNRPVGRMLPRVSEHTQKVETALGKRASEVSPIAVASPNITVAPKVEVPSAAVPSAPSKTATPGADGTVVLGKAADGADVLINLVGSGLMAVAGKEHQTQGFMAAMAGQLLTEETAESPELVLAHPGLEWLAKLLDHPMTPPADAWRQIKRRAISAAAWQGGDAWDAAAAELGGVQNLRDAGGGEAPPLIVFIDPAAIETPSLVGPKSGVTVVTTANQLPDFAGLANGSVDLVVELGDDDSACLWPQRRQFQAQLIMPPAKRALSDLTESLQSAEYPLAPWGQPVASAPVESNALWIVGSDAKGEGHAMAGKEEGTYFSHPQLRLLGPVDMVGARGVFPTRASKQCLEYCGWLLRYPGQTAMTMAGSLLVAEGTRRSNMSRLRLWLGADNEGEPYLPEAYSGRIRLHPCVTSDWEAVMVLVNAGVQSTSEANLIETLKLVRGAPLADAAPGQWHWAEEWRCDMVALIRDVGVVLCDKALQRGDIELARWAATRALIVAPDDDRLMMRRLQTEHMAGNRAEVDRLAYHITRSSKLIGFDLSDPMITMLQEVIEGAPRVRMAS